MGDKTLPRGLKASAVRAITGFDEDYHAEGGAAELEETLRVERASLAKRIYVLARKARKEARNLQEAQVLFKAACKFAEERFKRNHDIVNLSDRIPSWAQFKSRILRAMKHGIDPKDYQSERMLREALHEKLTKQGNGPTADASPQEPEAVSNWLEHTGVHDSMRFTLTRLVVASEYIRPRARKQAEAILAEAAKALSELVDQRRITGDATRDALDAARKVA